MIRFDKSARTIVTVCDCGWRSITLDMVTATRLAATHQTHANHAADPRVKDKASYQRAKEQR